MNSFIWIGIAFCITQSAIFSGLNLAFFSISKLRLEIEATQGNKYAVKVLALRKDANFLLATILWGNVAINVLLTILSRSVMTGLIAFLFSTFLITFLGEIIPQAYFSRNALKIAALLSPVINFYQILLFPVAKPISIILDKWLGKESINYFHEKNLEELIKIHMKNKESDINYFEGKGALNFLSIDEVSLSEEGEIIDPKSIISMRFENNLPVFPKIEFSASDEFLKKIELSGKKWAIITNEKNEPKMALNTDRFLRGALFNKDFNVFFNPFLYCHRPIIVKNGFVALGDVIPRLKVHPERADDDVIDEDIILYWGAEKRIITGADILGRLMRGIVQQQNVPFKKI
jgi:metal transporter CNNM